MIIVTLTKLLVINIVASVRSLSSRRELILWSFDVLLSPISAISDGDRLKNAISEPLAKADAPISSIVNMQAMYTPIVGATKCTASNDLYKKVK